MRNLLALLVVGLICLCAVLLIAAGVFIGNHIPEIIAAVSSRADALGEFLGLVVASIVLNALAPR